MGHIFDAISRADQRATQQRAARAAATSPPGPLTASATAAAADATDAPSTAGRVPPARSAAPQVISHPINVGGLKTADLLASIAATPAPAAPPTTASANSIHTGDPLAGDDDVTAAEATHAPSLSFVGAQDPDAGSLSLKGRGAGVRDDRLIPALDPVSPLIEDYRGLRTGVIARWQAKRHLVHVVTSALPREGKSLTSINLALAFAELSDRRTVLVEADLRLPRLSQMLGLGQEEGFSTLLQEQATVSSVLRYVGPHGLAVIPAGKPCPQQATFLLNGPSLARVLKELRQRFDHVIIDTPPVVDLADAGILGALADDLFLVVRMGLSTRTMIDQAMRVLAGYNAPVSALIATEHPRGRPAYTRQMDQQIAHEQLAQAA